jgi:hypothetical protein
VESVLNHNLIHMTSHKSFILSQLSFQKLPNTKPKPNCQYHRTSAYNVSDNQINYKSDQQICLHNNYLHSENPFVRPKSYCKILDYPFVRFPDVNRKSFSYPIYNL